MRSSGERTHVYIYISSIVTARPLSPQEGASLTLAPIILGECYALWGERERRAVVQSQCLTCAAGYQRAAVDAPLSHV